MSRRDVRLYLLDMSEAIDRIDTFTEGFDFETFVNDQKTQQAVIRNVEIIGEAANNLDERTFQIGKERYRIPWRDIIDFRNKVTHDYFGIIMDEVWYVVTEELPSLKQQVKQLKEEIENDSS